MNDNKKIEVFISIAELNAMIKAQKRGFRDIAEVYGTFWLDKEDALSCGRLVYKKFILIPND